MPQGRPQGAGGPMPGPSVPGGAGGAMPGMQRGPQGAGALMRRGGIVGYQNQGLVQESEIADELTYGEDPEQEYATGFGGGYEYDPTKGRGGSWLGTPEGDYSSGERSVLGDIGRFFGRGLGAAPYALAQAGTYGIANLIENIFPGQQFKGNYRGPEGQLLAKHLFRDKRDPASFYDPREKGFAGIMRRVPVEPSADDATVSEIEDWIAKQEGAGAGAGTRAGGMYQDLFERIADYEEAASIPSELEKNRYKLDEDRAKSLGGRRAGIEALMPTEEQYRLRGRGASFGALSKALARTGDPRKRQDFGQIGEAISGETDRQLAERLGFEEKLAGIDTDIYGVRRGSLGEQATRERAGEAFWPIELGARQSELEGRQAMNVATLRQQADSDYFRPQNLPSIINFINDPSTIDYMTPGTREAVVREISRRLSGGSSSDDVSNEDLVRLFRRLTEGS